MINTMDKKSKMLKPANKEKGRLVEEEHFDPIKNHRKPQGYSYDFLDALPRKT